MHCSIIDCDLFPLSTFYRVHTGWTRVHNSSEKIYYELMNQQERYNYVEWPTFQKMKIINSIYSNSMKGECTVRKKNLSLRDNLTKLKTLAKCTRNTLFC